MRRELASFPSELLLNIFSFLPWRSLLTCGHVCQLWRLISEDDFLWDPFYKTIQFSDQTLEFEIKLIPNRKLQFLTYISVVDNWKNGLYQHFMQSDMSAVLCLQATTNVLVVGAQNTSISLCDISQKQLQKSHSKVHKTVPFVESDMIIETAPPPKYIPPHRRTELREPEPINPLDLVPSLKMEETSSLCFDTKLTGNMDSIISIQYSECGNYLCSTSNDSSVRVWKRKNTINPLEFDSLHIFRTHTRSVRALDLYTKNENNILAATGSKDATVRIWNISQGYEADVIHVGGAVQTVQFSDGLVARFVTNSISIYI